MRSRSSGATGMIVPEYKIALLGSLGVGKSGKDLAWLARLLAHIRNETAHRLIS